MDAFLWRCVLSLLFWGVAILACGPTWQAFGVWILLYTSFMVYDLKLKT